MFRTGEMTFNLILYPCLTTPFWAMSAFRSGI